MGTLFRHASERAQCTVIALLITDGVLFLHKGLWSLICLTSFPNTCFSICLLVMSLQLVSDFVSTPVLKQRHGIKVTPPPVTCVILIMSKMISMFFSLRQSPRISLCRKYASLFLPIGAYDVSTFLSQSNNKLYFYLHRLIVLNEQASFLTEGLICKTLYVLFWGRLTIFVLLYFLKPGLVVWRSAS